MYRDCRRSSFADLVDELYFSRRRGGLQIFGGDPWGFGDGGDVDRSGFAPVSQRAMSALENAKQIFLQHLLLVDTSKGAVNEEIIKFHLVTDMRKEFNKWVKEYGCTAKSRQITRAEQDVINKSRKSLLHFTSVIVTPQAQRAYIEKNPRLVRRPAASAAALPMASASSLSTGTFTAASASGIHPLQDASDKKLKRQLNEAAVNHAASSRSHKKIQRNLKA